MIGTPGKLQADKANRRIPRFPFPICPEGKALVSIRQATVADYAEVARIFRQVISTGDSYVHAADTSDQEILAYWFGAGVPTYVAEVDSTIVGMYRFVPNQRDRGSHVANASFIVNPGYRHGGVGHALGLHCLSEARRAGYLAMQFNMVVSTNTRAVALWKRLGFAILATLPSAFRHEQLGLVDAYIMHRLL